VLKSENDFEELYAEVDRAGLEAVRELVALWLMRDPQLAGVDPTADSYIAGEGCGIASVIVSGRSSFGRWAKQFKMWEKYYPSGVRL
jgi:hypothetical protein